MNGKHFSLCRWFICHL